MGKRKGPSPRMRRAAGTNDAVEKILAWANQTWTEMWHIPYTRENAARLQRGQPSSWPRDMVARHGPEGFGAITDYTARYAIIDMWRKQSRVAYDIHPEMANSLYRADMKGKFPADLLSRLRHISPMIPLPHPWPYVSETREEGLIRAYFLVGAASAGFCTTTDERMDQLLLVPWIELPPEEGGDGQPDILSPLIALPQTDKPFTLNDVLKSASAWNQEEERPGDRELMRQLVPGALTLLSYLCCKNADIEEPPRTPTKGKRRPVPPRDPFYVRVGWHIGPKLHAARTRATGRSRDGISVPSGVEYGPQHRAGHTKTVWFGPKKTRSDVIWVDPYWTKLDTLDEGQEPGTQIVPVDAQSGDPASHKDIRRANLGTAKAREIAERERQQQRQDEWEF